PGPGEGPEDRADGHADQAPDEPAPATEHGGAPSPDQKEPAVPENTRRADPLQLPLGEVQRRADRGQSNLDERQVERVEEDNPAEHGEQNRLRPRPPLGRSLRVRCGWHDADTVPRTNPLR